MVHIFIVNPYAGKNMFTDDLRKKLEQIDDLRYFIFCTRNAGNETELVRKILHYFPNEKLRFYCCGGSGTMRNMLNGFESFENIDVAFFPCGMTNDFLKVFGEDEKRFSNIEELIHGDVILVDYIQTNHGIALNSFSVGIDSFMEEEKFRFSSVLGRATPYILALLSALFQAKPQEYIVRVDDQVLEGKMIEILLGNGSTLGGSLVFNQKPDIFNGYGTYVVGPDIWGLKLLPVLTAMLKKRKDKLEKYTRVGQCKSIVIERKDGQPFAVNFDGELVGNISKWQASIVKNGLRFVVPKGVCRHE